MQRDGDIKVTGELVLFILSFYYYYILCTFPPCALVSFCSRHKNVRSLWFWCDLCFYCSPVTLPLYG